MARTAKRLFGPAQLNGSPATTKYTVPAGPKTILREIWVSNPGGGSTVNLTMSIGTDAAGTRIFDAYPIQAGTVMPLQFHQKVLDAGEVIQAFASIANVLVLTLNGDELTLG